MKTPNVRYELSERLKTALAVGDTLALFPVLKDWSTEELKSLLKDLDGYHDFLMKAVDDVWKDTAMQVEYFFNRGMSNCLDTQRNDLKMELSLMCSEICSVVIYYLSARGEYDEEGS